LEDVVQKTQAKAEIRSYPWYSVRKMAREIVVGGEEKTHLCIECPTEMTSKAKRAPNDWRAALCNAKSSSNVWLHLQRKHRHARHVDKQICQSRLRSVVIVYRLQLEKGVLGFVR